MIEKAKFIYSPLGKALKKQIKATEDQGKISWSLALKALKSNKNNEDIKSFDRIYDVSFYMTTDEIKIK